VGPTPETLLLKRTDQIMVRRALETLPLAWREIIVLREFEGLSYKQIAEVAGIKIGTVMSRLARARGQLQRLLAADIFKEVAK
jgi:RNA polymerase sigma-70 factor (ECF subfamily)